MKTRQAVIHANVEGAVTYKALLFIPAKAPYDFHTKDFKKGLQLYSSGVKIMENCAIRCRTASASYAAWSIRRI